MCVSTSVYYSSQRFRHVHTTCYTSAKCYWGPVYVLRGPRVGVQVPVCFLWPSTGDLIKQALMIQVLTCVTSMCYSSKT